MPRSSVFLLLLLILQKKKCIFTFSVNIRQYTRRKCDFLSKEKIQTTREIPPSNS